MEGWLIREGQAVIGPVDDDTLRDYFSDGLTENRWFKRETSVQWIPATAFEAACPDASSVVSRGTSVNAPPITGHHPGVPAAGITTNPPADTARSEVGHATHHIYIAIAIVVTLFLGYRGVIYSNCRAGCHPEKDCAAEAEQMNPFAGFGARNDLGRAQCEMFKRFCLNSCSLF